MTSIFNGLSAFPLTPADTDGAVDTAALGVLVDRLASEGVDSIGLLGSTGIYAYLDRAERLRAVAAAVEAAAGRVPLIVGVGALRTSWAQQLAGDAERAGASGLLLAPMSYTSLTDGEAAQHYRAVAGATSLPLCIYSNPGTTNFTFSDRLLAELAAVPNITAIKIPLPADEDYAGELAQLRGVTPEAFAIGYSGDWGAAPSLLAGADAWYSVVAGLLPEPALRLTQAAQAGLIDDAAMVDAAFESLWALFRTHGSLRIMYAIADRLSLDVGDPPLPLLRVEAGIVTAVEAALDQLAAI
ncbi:dihydrodipicolinate synthase family protein [Novosphingobium endophyticum]|uniref:Dihydrodipicolinate synthase family protein n=1 Tax=Novosphingobium endophyticum TaxID=1955250 RepID=A0A916TSJ9_9SPHN|nr:dihydrodipicolinate synthase family protein [Novosphingobium endophyticum]GGC01088.1 dihydrodipicolinate synthase family protein [Novosphingobium endophyticum]